MLNQERSANRRREGKGWKKQQKELRGWREEGTRRPFNTTADRQPAHGLRRPQRRVAAWICWWPGVGISGVGPSAGHSLYAAALALNTEAPQGWATGVCGEAAGAVGWCAGAPAQAGKRGPACLLPGRPTPLKVQSGHRPAY